MDTILWALLGVIAGACIATQAPINAQLGRNLGVPIAAAGVSFVAGAVLLWTLALIYSRSSGIAINFAAPAPWTFVAGGVLGAIYVFSNIMLTPMIGAAAVMALSVAGQLIGGLALDRIGFMGMAVRELTLGRVTGAILLLVGAMMIRLL
ncbi:DMT family transporter [Devosia neptuniae]|jgi:transporter family-2 protein|uniref:DMT family transporter n=1 Tax=Devosia TaxID=46913 RepID=UPI0022AED266|nr:DMT family transporter [Devosia neptuniae]MCZ4346353.1 DMT family transporter [Devosia neptuniae]|tara:strand:+ start:16775 stop:17224 length:450 start_codon:yes stop_codon:yes gene_type:complete